MDILFEIVENKRIELAQAVNEMPLEVLKKLTLQRIAQDGKAKLRSMKQSLLKSPTGIIAEFKRKSPSKGWIHADADPVQVVTQYAKGGAAASSILTDEKYFGGRLEFIQRVRQALTAIPEEGFCRGKNLPLLRKEFIIDEPMVQRFIAFKKEHSFILGSRNIGLFSTDDELLGHEMSKRNAKAVEEAGFEIIWSAKFGHRCNDNAVKEIVKQLKNI